MAGLGIKITHYRSKPMHGNNMQTPQDKEVVRF